MQGRLLISFFLLIGYCEHISAKKEPNIRYLLYDVNPGEGFNLRRDVYVRFANIIRFANKMGVSENIQWHLVLPPWCRLYHWFRHRGQPALPWSEFFDISSLKLFVPVIEFHEFLQVTGNRKIDKVYYLQSLPFNGKWLEKVELQSCQGKIPFHFQQDKNAWFGWMFGYSELPIADVECLGVQAEVKTFAKFLLSLQPEVVSVMLDRGEHVISGSYSEWSPEWWTARRSLVFAKHLRQAANEFRRVHLESETPIDRGGDDWRRERHAAGAAAPAAYAAVHLRRRDFSRAHPDAVPSLASAASQLMKRLANRRDIRRVFVASDDESAAVELGRLLPLPTLRFSSPNDSLTDGQLAVIDQIVCAGAAVFVGTRHSTFSLRIVEERSLMGFDKRDSVGVFCESETEECEDQTFWQPQFEKEFTLTQREDL